MEITVEWLKEKSACKEAIDAFSSQNETDSIKILKKLIENKKLDWANWLIVRLMDYRMYVSYAVYAAEQIIDIFDKKYPDDKRPRQAIEAAKKCIKSPSKKNKESAWSAAESAESAWSAAWSAWSAAESAESAWSAWSAAWSAARIKILKYGIKLLRKP